MTSFDISFSLDDIKHYRMPTAEEEIAAAYISKLEERLAALSAWKTYVEEAAGLELGETYTAVKLIEHIRKSVSTP